MNSTYATFKASAAKLQQWSFKAIFQLPKEGEDRISGAATLNGSESQILVFEAEGEAMRKVRGVMQPSVETQRLEVIVNSSQVRYDDSQELIIIRDVVSVERTASSAGNAVELNEIEVQPGGAPAQIFNPADHASAPPPPIIAPVMPQIVTDPLPQPANTQQETKISPQKRASWRNQAGALRETTQAIDTYFDNLMNQKNKPPAPPPAAQPAPNLYDWPNIPQLVATAGYKESFIASDIRHIPIPRDKYVEVEVMGPKYDFNNAVSYFVQDRNGSSVFFNVEKSLLTGSSAPQIILDGKESGRLDRELKQGDVLRIMYPAFFSQGTSSWSLKLRHSPASITVVGFEGLSRRELPAQGPVMTLLKDLQRLKVGDTYSIRLVFCGITQLANTKSGSSQYLALFCDEAGRSIEFHLFSEQIGNAAFSNDNVGKSCTVSRLVVNEYNGEYRMRFLNQNRYTNYANLIAFDGEPDPTLCARYDEMLAQDLFPYPVYVRSKINLNTVYNVRQIIDEEYGDCVFAVCVARFIGVLEVNNDNAVTRKCQIGFCSAMCALGPNPTEPGRYAMSCTNNFNPHTCSVYTPRLTLSFCNPDEGRNSLNIIPVRTQNFALINAILPHYSGYVDSLKRLDHPDLEVNSYAMQALERLYSINYGDNPPTFRILIKITTTSSFTKYYELIAVCAGNEQLDIADL